jgi:hypothetical protein
MARKRIIDLTTAATLSRNQSGSLITLANADGLTVTLPAPGRGLNYEFVVKTSITHGTAGYIVQVADVATSSIKGAVVAAAHNGASKVQASSGAEKISTTSAAGGLIGSTFKVTCNNDGKWEVTGVSVGGDTTVFA